MRSSFELKTKVLKGIVPLGPQLPQRSHSLHCSLCCAFYLLLHVNLLKLARYIPASSPMDMTSPRPRYPVILVIYSHGLLFISLNVAFSMTSFLDALFKTDNTPHLRIIPYSPLLFSFSCEYLPNKNRIYLSNLLGLPWWLRW